MKIKAEEIGKEFKWKGESVRVFNGLSLEVSSGELVCITGKSGSGKSTLLNILAGMLRTSEGEIWMNESSFSGMNDKQLSLLRCTKIGYVMQGQSLLPDLSIIQNVMLPVLFAPKSENKDALEKRAEELMEALGILKFADRYPGKLSGGEARRVSAARAMLMEPELLLADEPTGDLDEETSQEMMKLLHLQAEKGTAVLMVTHDTRLLSYASSVYHMDAGKLQKLQKNRTG